MPYNDGAGNEYLRNKANNLPKVPGVYFMKDGKGKIIYIGKAKSLKNRVTSYFRTFTAKDILLEPKTYRLTENISDFDFIVTATELDALILEASQIKHHKPKYNILLKDDRGFNYVKISRGSFPKLTYTHHNTDKTAEYIGPYANGYTIKQAVDDANHIFMLPDCGRKFPQEFGKARPCLNFHIKRCIGVCRGNISSNDYNVRVNDAIEYIKGGSRKTVPRLTAEMERLSENLEFEKAAAIRDTINSILKVEKTQQILTDKITDYDVIGIAMASGQASAAILKYRDGRLQDKENCFIGEEYPPGEMLRDFMTQYYSRVPAPPEIYIETEITENTELLEKFFAEKSGDKNSDKVKIKIKTPKKGDALKQILLAKSNASEYLAMKTGRTSKELSALEELSKLLKLAKIPAVIECYDISNIGSQTVVGGMTVFRNGRPFKAGYRKFIIKDIEDTDDYGAMKEMLGRRFRRLLGGDENFGEKPDLVLIDGGKGHISAVNEVFTALEIDIPLFGLVKDDRHHTRAVVGFGGEIQIKETRPVFSLLTAIQDETHRCAVSFSRSSHAKKSYKLVLTEVPGIGAKKAENLLKQFKTKAALKAAGIEQLRGAAKITEEKAAQLRKFIGENL